MNETEFVKSIKTGRKRLYYLYGNERLLAEGCISALAKQCGTKPLLLDAATAPLEQLEGEVYSYSLLAGNRVLVLSGFFLSALDEQRLGEIEKLLPDIPEDLTVVLQAIDPEKDRFSLPKRVEKLLALPAGGGAAVLAAKKTGSDLLELIARLAKREGSSIERAAARRLVELKGEDALELEGEVSKLAAASSYGAITKDLVEQLTARTVEAGVYDMLRSVQRGDSSAALSLLDDMLRGGEDPMMIAGVMNTAFVNMVRAAALRRSGGSLQDMFSGFDYRSGDQKVEIAWRQSQDLGFAALGRIVELLYQLDLDLKSSRQDVKTILLETAVCEISALAAPAGRRR